LSESAVGAARPTEGASTVRPLRETVPSAFWLAFWLIPPLVGAKAVHWDWPGIRGLPDYLRDVAIASSADIGFALAFGLLAAGLLRLLRRRPTLRQWIGRGLVAVGALCAVYAVASIQIFAFLRSQLTYPLLYLAGDMKRMGSSLGSFLTLPIAVAGVVVPGVYVAAQYLSPRWVLPGKRPLRTAVWLAGLVSVGGGVFAGLTAAEGRWSDRADHLIARNPHWAFVASLAREWGGGVTPSLGEHFPQEFLEDFRPHAESNQRPPWLPTASGRPVPAPARPRNVLLVVLESVGAQHLSLYGSPYDSTPCLAEEARYAAVFDNFYCHVGLTANSLAAITLSVYPFMTWREYTQEYPDFPGAAIGNVLVPRGYRTAFLHTGFLDYVGQDRFLSSRGFEDMEDWDRLGNAPPMNSWGGTDNVLIDRTLAWIDQDRSRPFYALLWTTQSHHPYDPVPGEPEIDFFEGRVKPEDDWDLGRYLNTVKFVDRQLGRLFAGLRARGLDRDTVVLVTGDHGEAFGAPHPTWGHGFRVWQESVRVPMMVWSPRLFPRGVRSPVVGGHVDVSPTILDLIGVPSPPSWEGRSLFSRSRPGRAYFYAVNDDYLLGLREGDFKYIYNATRGRDELYDLVHDPQEERNIASAQPERVRALRGRVAAWKFHAGERLGRAQDEMDAKRRGSAPTVQPRGAEVR
jgi:arylsulfatase A-like enzyme